jgi:hypothetical protein
LLAEDPAEGETEAPVCVGFSVGEVRAAALKDSERMKEAALQHEMKVNDVLERRAAGGDSRAMVMPIVEAQVIAVIIRGLPAMPLHDIPAAQTAWLTYLQQKSNIHQVS